MRVIASAGLFHAPWHSTRKLFGASYRLQTFPDTELAALGEGQRMPLQTLSSNYRPWLLGFRAK